MKGPRNTLGDLNNHLFEQMERLNDESLKGEKLNEEIRRADSMAKVSMQIIGNANLVLKAEQYRESRLDTDREMPRMLGGK